MSQTTTFETFLNLLNGYVGSGILANPKAFSDGGLLVASVLLPIIGLIANHCIHLVVAVNEFVCARYQLPPQDYEQVAEYAVELGPKPLQKYAKWAKFATALFIFSSQVGACSVYFLFMAENLKNFFEYMNLFDGRHFELSVYLGVLLPIMILLQCIRNIKYLTIPSTLANLLQIGGMAIILYNVSTDIPPISERKLIGNKFPLFFVTTIFNFEGISIAIPLYTAMKNPKAFGKLFGVLDIVIVFIISFNFILGFLGYLKYGDSVAAVITLSLPDDPLYAFVQLAYALAVMMTFPITLIVPIQMCWPAVKNMLLDKKLSFTAIEVCDFAFRICLVMLTYAMASLIPKLDLILSLVGALASSCIAIIIPAVIHGICFWNECKTTNERIYLSVKNSLIALMGILAFILGTYYSLIDLIDALKMDGNQVIHEQA